MPELAEPPAPTTPAEKSDLDALKSNFNTALQAETGVDPKATADDAPEPDAKPTLIPATPAPKADPATPTDDSIVPAQFTGKPAEEKKDDPTEILTAKDRGELVAKLGGKAQESFNRLETAAKAKIAALQTQADELRKKLDTAPAGPSKEHEEALKAASARAAELEEKLERAAFADSPRFQKYGSEISAELTSAKAYLEGTSISPAVLEVAASQAGQNRLKTLRDAGMDSETIAAIGPHLARADAIRRERDASLEHWKADYTKEQEQTRQQAAQQEAARQKQEQEVWDRVAAEMRGKHPAYTKVDGHAKWNDGVDARERRSEDFAMGRLPLDELFRIGRAGVGAEAVQAINTELTKQLNAANEELARLKAAQPGTGHTNTTVSTTKPTSDEESYKSNFNAALAQARG